MKWVSRQGSRSLKVAGSNLSDKKMHVIRKIIMQPVHVCAVRLFLSLNAFLVYIYMYL